MSPSPEPLLFNFTEKSSYGLLQKRRAVSCLLPVHLPSSSTLPLCFQTLLVLPFLISARGLQRAWGDFFLASPLASSEVMAFTLPLRQHWLLIHLLSVTPFVYGLSSPIVFSPAVICGDFNEAWGGEEIKYAFNLAYFHDFFNIIKVK